LPERRIIHKIKKVIRIAMEVFRNILRLIVQGVDYFGRLKLFYENKLSFCVVLLALGTGSTQSGPPANRLSSAHFP
tara:strand:- start:26 stop:253 length:228 start_codon:yes stop_codon:yes gene_type:complete